MNAQVKNKIVTAVGESFLNNKEKIKTYYKIGRLLIKAQGGEEKAKYDDGLIKKWSEKLTKEYGNGYGITNLKNMRKFYIIFKKATHCVANLIYPVHTKINYYN